MIDAAGLNAGAAETAGEVLLLANPDISFFPGSVLALLAGVERGFDVVGPQFVWDEPDWDDINNHDSSPIGFLKGTGLTDE